MSSSLPANVHVSQHPCLKAKLSQLRSQSTGARETKLLVHEIAMMVGYEALASGLESTQAGTDTSPLGYTYPTTTISPSHVSLVPILRSGLGMVDAIAALLPSPCPIFHLGMYREKTTLSPVEYYNNLPYHNTSPTTNAEASATSTAPSPLALLIDPIVATGATMAAAIDTLRDWGVERVLCISVLGSADGLRKVAGEWPGHTEVWVAGVDADVDARGMIRPGLGDVGDRLFGTVGK